MRVSAIALVAIVLLVLPPIARTGSAATNKTPLPVTKTPIKHFVSIMQENHTFDNYFGTYPGADGFPAGVCMPEDPSNANSECVKPYRIGKKSIEDLEHTTLAHAAVVNAGKMDQFVAYQSAQGLDGSIAMGYYDYRDLGFYWSAAREYVLFDRFFTSWPGGSFMNHVYWVAAQSSSNDRDTLPAEGLGSLPTIFDRLEAKGISWKFYVQDYDSTVNYRSGSKSGKGSQTIWVPLINYARYLDDPKLASHIVDLREYYSDLQRGTLPAVSYIVPYGASEHPPGGPDAGQRFVKSLVNAMMTSYAWRNSAMLISWDDWGGWYDHVVPPKVDDYGYGLRVPSLLVSPYARKGQIDHTQLDFTSILKFIEDNWNIEPLAARDTQANNLTSAFDFSAGPRDAKFIPSEYVSAEASKRKVSRGVYLIPYLAAFFLVMLILAAVVLGSRSSNGGIREGRFISAIRDIVRDRAGSLIRSFRSRLP